MIQSDYSEILKNIRLSHEDEMARGERNIRRLWILCIVIFLAFVLSNCAWIVYESSYQDVTIEAEQDGDGTNVISGGDLNYGSESTDN